MAETQQTEIRPIAMRADHSLVTVQCRPCRKTYYLMLRTEALLEWTGSNPRHIQDVFGDLSAGDRELILSHTCERCFDNMFANAEEDEEEW